MPKIFFPTVGFLTEINLSKYIESLHEFIKLPIGKHKHFNRILQQESKILKQYLWFAFYPESYLEIQQVGNLYFLEL